MNSKQPDNSVIRQTASTHLWFDVPWVKLLPKICEAGCGRTFLRIIGDTRAICPTCARQLAVRQ